MLSHSKYDQQIFINLLDTRDLLELTWSKNKYSFKNGTCSFNLTIDANDKLIYSLGTESAIAEIRAALTYKTRIYLLAHGADDPKFLLNNEKKSLSYMALTNFLMEKIFSQLPEKNMQKPLKDRLKLSLISCSSGRTSAERKAELINNSFAAHLLYAFKRRGFVNIAISARLGEVLLPAYNSPKKNCDVIKNSCSAVYDRLVDTLKVTSDLPDSVIDTLNTRKEQCYYPLHDNAAKVIYYYLGEQQAIAKAYANNSGKITDWREHVLDVLNACIARTGSVAKKIGLGYLISDICMLESNSDVFSLLKKALAGTHPEYELNTHSSIFAFGQTRTELEVQKLISQFSAS